MPARHDILDRPESLRNPLMTSMALHAALAASVVIYGVLPSARLIPWGDPNSLGGGAVAITPVSKIPLPPRAGRVNPLANDTESQVPAPPERAKPQPRQPEEDPDAIALKSRRPAKPAPTRRAQSRNPVKPEEEPENQLYSPGGAAANSQMFGSTKSGSGGVGLGQGNPFGERFGAYAAIIRQMVASKWNTSQVDPRLQTAPMVIITFEIGRDGSARNLRLLQRSGITSLDYSAQRAILEASPFPPLPPGFERNSAVIEFWFELKR